MNTMSEVIGRYQIRSELGRGGMAAVYLAYDPLFDREVALKTLPPAYLYNQTLRTRFQREARSIAAIEHPSIVPVYDVGEEGGRPYLVMRYMPGGSLAERLDGKPMTLAKIIELLQTLASALDKVHAKGILHRDLKPGNILFDGQGNVALSDFGIARLAEAGATLTGSALVGTPFYISPEQALGEPEIDGRTDIYALGVILFELLTGSRPYTADTPMGVAMKHVLEPVPHLPDYRPDLPAGYGEVVQRAMAKEPDRRFATAAEMVNALTAVNTNSATAASPKPIKAAPQAQKRGRLSFTTLGIVSLLLLIAALIAAAITGERPLAVAGQETATSLPIVVTMTRERATTTPPPTSRPASRTMAQATSMPTITPSPTLLPTPTNTPTKRPTATATAVPAPQIRPIFDRINVRAGPGTNYAVTGALAQTETAVVLAFAQSGDETWYNVQLAGGGSGWVAAAVVAPFDETALDAVAAAVTIPPSPTLLPTSTATAVPALVPVTYDELSYGQMTCCSRDSRRPLGNGSRIDSNGFLYYTFTNHAYDRMYFGTKPGLSVRVNGVAYTVAPSWRAGFIEQTIVTPQGVFFDAVWQGASAELEIRVADIPAESGQTITVWPNLHACHRQPDESISCQWFPGPVYTLVID